MKIVIIAEMVISVLLVISILLQNRGAGLSSTFGGDFGGYYSKRGFEKFLSRFTSILAIFFIGLAIASLFLSNK